MNSHIYVFLYFIRVNCGILFVGHSNGFCSLFVADWYFTATDDQNERREYEKERGDK